MPDSHQAAPRGGRWGAADVLRGPVERGRGVTVQGAARHIFQQLLLHRPSHWYQELQRGEMLTHFAVFQLQQVPSGTINRRYNTINSDLID